MPNKTRNTPFRSPTPESQRTQRIRRGRGQAPCEEPEAGELLDQKPRDFRRAPRTEAPVGKRARHVEPSGKPERSRADELTGVDGPVLVVQGEKDQFGSPGEIGAAVVGQAGCEVVAVPGVGHGLKPTSKRADPAVSRSIIVDAVADFVTARVG